jgi:hypothetical protein
MYEFPKEKVGVWLHGKADLNEYPMISFFSCVAEIETKSFALNLSSRLKL